MLEFLKFWKRTGTPNAPHTHNTSTVEERPDDLVVLQRANRQLQQKLIGKIAEVEELKKEIENKL